MTLKTYRFINKDPVIDLLRTAIQAYAETEGIKFGKALSNLAETSGISLGTLYNWFHGDTRYPQYRSVAAIAIALQLKFSIGERKADLRIVHHRRAG